MAKHKKIRVGDKVRFRFGLEMVEGVITEERGPIGGGGRQLYFIEFPMGPEVTFPIELTADDFEVVPKNTVPEEKV